MPNDIEKLKSIIDIEKKLKSNDRNTANWIHHNSYRTSPVSYLDELST